MCECLMLIFNQSGGVLNATTHVHIFTSKEKGSSKEKQVEFQDAGKGIKQVDGVKHSA